MRLPVHLSPPLFAAALAATLALAACDGSPDVPRVDGGSFLALQTQVFTPTCATAGCHVASSRAGNLVLDPGASYAALLDVRPTNTAARDGGFRHVRPRDPGRGQRMMPKLVSGVLAPVLALLAAIVITSAVVVFVGASPVDFWEVMLSWPSNRSVLTVLNQAYIPCLP